EDWPNSRLLRDSHLGSIWEGSSNVIALDVLRCLKQYGAHRVITDSMLEKLAALEATDAAPGATQLTELWHDLRTRGDALLEGENSDAQALIGHYTNALAQGIMATLLLEQGIHESTSATGYRKLLVAN